MILSGHVDEAVQLLEEAFASVQGQEQREVALAGVGVQILLCASLSQAAPGPVTVWVEGSPGGEA